MSRRALQAEQKKHFMVNFVTETINLQPPVFTTAVAQITATGLRAELDYDFIAPPKHLAPHAFALAAGVNQNGTQVTGEKADIDSDIASGRLLLLHDPAQVDTWGNDFRFICYAQADIEVEIGVDPLVSEVSWSYLVDSLITHNADYTALSGTATKTISTGYGALAKHGTGAQLQLRASWTPGSDDFAAHVRAWADLLCLLGGLPQHEKVARLKNSN